MCITFAGLQIKVAFGTVWKESLSELSGGQKSLLALSLMLAMLLFKPAPIYILDEVRISSAASINHSCLQRPHAHSTVEHTCHMLAPAVLVAALQRLI